MHGYAHKNGSVQSGVPHESYTLVTLPTLKCNVGGLWDASLSRLIIPAACTLMMSGQVWVQSGAKIPGNGNATFVAKIVKNGNINVGTGIGTYGSVYETAVMPLPAIIDDAEADDYYELKAFVSAHTGVGGTSVLD